MTSLFALQKRASEVFPGQNLNAVHYLYVWPDVDKAALGKLLRHSGLTPARFQEALQPLLANPDEGDRDILGECIRGVEAGATATGWHLLRVLCDQPRHRITTALVQAGLDLKGLRKGLEENHPQSEPLILRGGPGAMSEILPYGRDLTAEAAQGAFDDLCPRPEELEKLINILLRKERPNPVITGPAGVGKTALVELLARQIVREEVPPKLRNTPVFAVSMGRLVAGTKYRGDFEQRFYAVLAMAKRARAILFIDEFHLVWGAGRAEGAPMDAANLLKSELDREGEGTLRIIGATTSAEFHEYVGRDKALQRRFEELHLEEPKGEALLGILRKKREGLEKHHGVTIPDLLVVRAAELTDRFLPNQNQPAKAVDLLDSGAARAVSRGATTLTEDDLLKALEVKTGSPLSALDETEARRLLALADLLKQKIVGQDEAIGQVVATLIYRRQHLGKPEKNWASFLFVGNTGVGKTELARLLAFELFGSEQALLHLNMGEYQGFDAVSKLIGTSLPGARSAGGTLTGWLYARGTGLILFDEIEKASGDIYHLLLGMLDRGRIRDARGQELDTRHCVIVFTSNAVDPTSLGKGSAGFFSQSHPQPMEQRLIEILAKTFPKEFLTRLDAIILFRDLTDEDLTKILRLRLKEGFSRFAQQGVRVQYNEAQLLAHLLRGLKELGGGGARGVDKVLDRLVFQPLALVLAMHPQVRPITLVLGEEFYRVGAIHLQFEEERAPHD